MADAAKERIAHIGLGFNPSRLAGPGADWLYRGPAAAHLGTGDRAGTYIQPSLSPLPVALDIEMTARCTGSLDMELPRV